MRVHVCVYMSVCVFVCVRVCVCTGLDEPPAGDVAGEAVRQHLVREGQVDQLHGAAAVHRSGKLQQGDVVPDTADKKQSKLNVTFHPLINSQGSSVGDQR